MVVFEGDPSGTPSKNGVTVISDRNYNVWARDPLGIPQFFSFNIATLWGHAHDDAHWYAQKSCGILMISYLLWKWYGKGRILIDEPPLSEVLVYRWRLTVPSNCSTRVSSPWQSFCFRLFGTHTQKSRAKLDSRLPCFSVCNTENREEPGDKATV